MSFLKQKALTVLMCCCFSATAMTTPDLAQKKACMSCHSIDKAVLGPAFKDVAHKYRDQKGMDAKLAEKVLKGGGGTWKMPMGPMPAQTQVNAAEARQLVNWILSLK